MKSSTISLIVKSALTIICVSINSTSGEVFDIRVRYYTGKAGKKFPLIRLRVKSSTEDSIQDIMIGAWVSINSTSGEVFDSFQASLLRLWCRFPLIRLRVKSSTD